MNKATNLTDTINCKSKKEEKRKQIKPNWFVVDINPINFRVIWAENQKDLTFENFQGKAQK
ncbi:CLUMA_CG002468, isoform A [Clunio marinus]|uniref:CLUMA_CG002468, isoform A n=1 Tax=Clunio marinus TaxID=568069 RepID=A0A1J1HQ58_9DIPT|nr:CLUMA_CG002468, isoform A [Clunio marinus]